MRYKGIPFRKRVQWYWWSLRNFMHGLRFDPMGRCRYCDHTTPNHYSTCRTLLRERA